MERFLGKGVSPGIAIGKIHVVKKTEHEIRCIKCEDTLKECEKYEAARAKVQSEREELYEKTVNEAGEEAADIFQFHVAILDEDEDLTEGIMEMIREEGCNAEYAVETVFEQQADVFRNMDDAYYKARSADIVDVKNAVLAVLFGDNDNDGIKAPCILAAEDFAPSDTVKLDRKMLLGMVTRFGSSNSHTAILARSMNIPAIIGCDPFDESIEGKNAVIDSNENVLIIDPTDDVLKKYRDLIAKETEKEIKRKELIGKESITKDGRKVLIYANIGGPDDVENVKANDAEGIGLFRSEFLYIGRSEAPGEEDQFQAYKKVVSELAPKQVIIRTCDIGADKQAEYLGLSKEENPALGLRAIRISLSNIPFFKTQLRALLRASYYGNMGIMFPMIISVDELLKCKATLRECEEELKKEGIPVGEPKIGIMIETPAAVLMAEELSKECDFFSIGTNDLTQYTLAIDRQNAALDPFLDTHHPAVLKAISMTVEAGHKNDCMVGICGELAGDTDLTEEFINMGVDELSVSPAKVLSLREKVREI